MNTMNDKLDVVLIHHPTSDIHRPILFPAMGLFSLADMLSRKGIRTKIVHLGVEKLLDPGFDAVDYVSAKGARIAALSVHWFFQLPDCLQLAKRLKEVVPDAIIVFGGFTASFFDREIVEEHGYVDAVVRGDGERPFLEFCKACLDEYSGDLSDVPNLVYRTPTGEVRANPFVYTITEEELTDCNFSNLNLMRHHKEYLGLTFQPTKRFRERLAVGAGGIFPLQTGRGCPFACTFCGGSLEAQKRINHRNRPLFRSVESVLTTIKEVMEYGCASFYICFDPDPDGDYYLRLFRQIRKEKLELRMAFGCWKLPSKQFIDEFKDTFVDGSFEISPETASETLRNANKGLISFPNKELEECLAYIESKDLICQLFFGYFLPGDTVDTVMETQRYARRFESTHCESFYLAFTTDPASLLYLRPEDYDIDIDVRSLKDYIAALSRKRTSPNLLAHRPSEMSPEEAQKIILALGNISFLYKVFPLSIQSIEAALGDSERVEKMVEDLCRASAEKPGQPGAETTVANTTREFRNAVGALAPELKCGSPDLLDEIIDFESVPYVLLEEHFSKISAHYSVYCTEKRLEGEELIDFIQADSTVVEERTFQHDVLKVMRSETEDSFAHPVRQATLIGIAVDSRGQVATFYPDQIDRADRLTTRK